MLNGQNASSTRAGTVESRRNTQVPAPSISAVLYKTKAGPLDTMGTIVSFPRGSQVFGEGDPIKYLYVVVSGGVRSYRYTYDGDRQISGFYLPGDLFGLEVGGRHALSTEVISNTAIRVIRQAAILEAALRDADVAQFLWISVCRQLSHDREHIVRLGRTAVVRLSDFILEIAERVSTDWTLELPMPRQDIADHLGITIETVSRTLTALEEIRVVDRVGRRIRIRSPRSLKRLREGSLPSSIAAYRGCQKHKLEAH